MDQRPLDVNGTTLNVIEVGDGAPVLLLHGNASRTSERPAEFSALVRGELP